MICFKNTGAFIVYRSSFQRHVWITSTQMEFIVLMYKLKFLWYCINGWKTLWKQFWHLHTLYFIPKQIKKKHKKKKPFCLCSMLKHSTLIFKSFFHLLIPCSCMWKLQFSQILPHMLSLETVMLSDVKMSYCLLPSVRTVSPSLMLWGKKNQPANEMYSRGIRRTRWPHASRPLLLICALNAELSGV